MIVTLPYPPSANRYLRHTSRGTYRTKEANSYKDAAQWMAKSQHFTIATGFVLVNVTLHQRLTKKNEPSATVMDLDNCIKVAMDALQGIAFENDKQVRRIVMNYGLPMRDGGLTLEVLPL